MKRLSGRSNPSDSRYWLTKLSDSLSLIVSKMSVCCPLSDLKLETKTPIKSETFFHQ